MSTSYNRYFQSDFQIRRSTEQNLIFTDTPSVSGTAVDLILDPEDDTQTITPIVVNEYENGDMRAEILGATGPQTFGLTWKPQTTGNYFITSVIEDNMSNRASDSSVVDVYTTSNSGVPPIIELGAIESPKTFSGSTLSEKLIASARDTDGQIISVDFYINGNLVGSDPSSLMRQTLTTPPVITRYTRLPGTMPATL